MGHTNVQVLNGGFPKWLKEGRPVESTDSKASLNDFAYKENPKLIMTTPQMRAYVKNENSIQSKM